MAEWRLVYDDSKVIALFETNTESVTYTNQNVFVAETKQECLTKINELVLVYEDITQ